MYSRLEHGQTTSAENVARQYILMPDIRNPNQRQAYNLTRHSGLDNYGDLARRYNQYDDSHQEIAFDPEDHRQAYHHEPYQPSPQDIPFLSRNAIDEQLYDLNSDQPPVLRYQNPRESLQPDSDTTSTSPSTEATQSTGKWKNIKLYRGNLVLDCPVPPKLLKGFPQRPPSEHDEFTHMRYTAATCDPSEFFNQRFTLRQQLFGQRRHTELLIVVTMYNEGEMDFARTMTGVFKNIEYMCSGKCNDGGSWGKDGWKKIVVCIVSDGRTKIHHRTKAVLTALGVYQGGIGTQRVEEKEVTAHIYEYTTNVGIEINNDIVKTKPGVNCPVQMIFCLKEKNQQKINSHRWALQAFGEVLQPNICVLLDVGTRPGDDSIYQLWLEFDKNSKCGGACGEIKAMIGKGGEDLLKNPLVAAQNFEYKMSNLLDKPMESAFGFISVLPGAFSAYRFVALQNDKDGEGPLEKYFAGEKLDADAGVFEKNMYLAEDRILCFELVAKRDAAWVLSYVKSAQGETDVPETMSELIKQRRRWLNGSFFATVYALTHVRHIFRSSHSGVRKVFFLIEFLYQLISMVFAWFAVGNFFLVFQILTTSLGGSELLGTTGEVLSVIIEWIYLGSLVTCFVLSLGNTPDGSKRFYMVMVFTWGGIMIYLMFASIFISIKSVQVELGDRDFTFSKMFSNSIFFTLIVSLLSTYILWIFVSIVFLDPWHIVTSSIQYLLLSPSYTNVINVYAFCNTHDVSWGTKGDDKPKTSLGSAKAKSDGIVDLELSFDDGDLDDLYDSELQKFSTITKKEKSTLSASDVREAYYKGVRSYVVLIWMFCNAALVAIVLKAGGLNRLSVQQQPSDQGDPSATVKVYLTVVLWSVAVLSAFKFVGAMWYRIIRMFRGY